MARALESRNWRNIRGLLQRMNDLRDTRCRVYNNANQNVNSATWTALTMNSERFDPNGMHNPAVNPTRITFATAGTYLVGGGTQFAPDGIGGVGTRYISIWLGGVTVLAFARFPVSNAENTHMVLSTLYDFTAADYVELQVRQTSGAVLNSLAAGNYAPEFWAQRFA